MVPVVVISVIAAAAVVALAHGPGRARPRPIADDRLVARLVRGADYVDNYAAAISTEATIDTVEAVAVQKGRLVERSDTEVVFTDGAPGLTFFVAYALSGPAGSQVLELTTAVHYSSRVGRLYFFAVRPVHRLVLPWLTWWTARRAEAQHAPRNA